MTQLSYDEQLQWAMTDSVKSSTDLSNDTLPLPMPSTGLLKCHIVV